MKRETLEKIEAVIEVAERMRTSFFWKPPTGAMMRRCYEKTNSIETVTWKESGHVYTARFETRCSCAHIYATGIYTKDGKKTTLLAIRNSYKRLAVGA